MKEKSDKAVRYVKNPDVVLREEDSDGGLLFNPDTNQIRVLNETGLFVWELCDGSRDLEDISSSIKESFDNVPDDQPVQVTEFVEEMTQAGFFSIVEE